MTNPAQYITGMTVQEQMDELIDYVDTRAAEVAAGVAKTYIAGAGTVTTGWTREDLVIETLDGLTIVNADNQPGVSTIYYNNSMAIVDVALIVSGTYTGATGWQRLFTHDVLDQNYMPYVLWVTTSASTVVNMVGGNYLELTNGTTYNIDLRYTFVVPITEA